ncbi:MAG: hypothetical protein A3C47_03175 [Omnitrophica bacterium RIFCSPHIGHO2_02_FULL_51_18]|nr:MAG: hypothetical protein A3C47_03175 [Omnitrophica bacterium RIFCSPHIGHO2_02_FULL_51_18]
MSANHNGKINEALELLNEAAQTKKDEILKLITNKYSDFRETVEATRERAGEVIEDGIKLGQVRVKKAAREMDKNVHKNPWAFIGGAAATALLLGFVLGKATNKD